MPSQNDVITVLKTIFDPEIPVDIYELGLIYEVKFSDAEGGQKVDIQMTLTSPNCPVAESMPNDVKRRWPPWTGSSKRTSKSSSSPPGRRT